MLNLIYPISAGFFAFLATIIGSYFFKSNQQYYMIGIGILFYLAANHLLYKMKFNSYKELGSTITTVLIFVSQIACMVIWKM